MVMPRPDATPQHALGARRGFDRDFVIYGHRDPLLQEKERAILTRSLEAATVMQDSTALRLARMRLDNLGGRVALDVFHQMEGEHSKNWLVHPTCQSCHEDVFLRAAHSLLARTQYYHHPLEPAAAPQERCELRVGLHTVYPEHSGAHGHAAPRTNRAAFYQPEHIARFIQIVRKVLGQDYRPELPEQILAHADRNKIWDKVHDPVLAPFQLLTLRDNQFEITFSSGKKSVVGFMLHKQRSAADIKAGQIHPSIVRMYAHFLPRDGHGVEKLHTIPALRHYAWDGMPLADQYMAPPRALHETLIAQKFYDAQLASTRQQRLFPIDKAAVPPPNFGKDIANHEYFVVSAATAHRMAPHSYAAIKQQSADGAAVHPLLTALAAQTDMLIEKYRTPLRRKKTPTPISPRAA